LMLAVVLKRSAMVKRLLKEGADPNTRTRKGWAMVDISLKKQDYKTANILLSFGAKRPKALGAPKQR